MSEIRISYDLYDGMCDVLSELGAGEAIIPSWNVIKRLHKLDVGLTAGLLAYFSENATASNDDEKKRLTYINELISEYVEFFEGDEPDAGVTVIKEGDYTAITELAKECIPYMKKDMPKESSVVKQLGPYIRYCFLLAYCFYEKAAGKAPGLKKILVDNFRLEWDEKPVEITQTEYEALLDDFASNRYGNEHWVPDMEDVMDYIIPNFPKCYDFVFWIIETQEPKSGKEKATISYLRELFDKNVRILDKNGKRSETLWS